MHHLFIACRKDFMMGRACHAGSLDSDAEHTSQEDKEPERERSQPGW